MEPTKLIEILTKQPEFYDVHQSRGTTQEVNRKELRFGIDFKLKDFDLATYWFPIRNELEQLILTPALSQREMEQKSLNLSRG